MRSTACQLNSLKVFHVDTSPADDDRVLTSGGRVLVRHRAGHTVAEAQQRAYALMTDIHWDGSFSRRDRPGAPSA
ncbi:phosphoribosylglycinamide synthetase C domain-containing protein [Shigella flexneri]